MRGQKFEMLLFKWVARKENVSEQESKEKLCKKAEPVKQKSLRKEVSLSGNIFPVFPYYDNIVPHRNLV